MNTERKAALILVATTWLAALGWIFSKETIQGFPPIGFIGLRFIIASLCLLPFSFNALRRANIKEVLPAALTGCILCSSVMCWIHAISISETIGEGAFIASLSMLMVPIVAWALFRERPPRIFWFSLPIAIAGLAALSLVGGWHSSMSQLWFAASAALLALHFNVNSQYSQRLPVLMLTCVQLFAAGCLASCLSLFTEEIPNSIEPSIWGWFALSTLLATSLRYVMQTLGQKNTRPGNAALIMILEPVWTVILSIVWYGEVFALNKVIGCSLILLALLIYRTNGRFIRIKR